MRLFLLLSLSLVGPIAQGWENHALLSAVAVADMPEVRDSKAIKVESLEDFLVAQRLSIWKVLEEEERWARIQVENYPERPNSLRFDPNTKDKALLKTRFFQALRVNPSSKFALFLQELPARQVKGAKYLLPSDVTLLPNSLTPTSRSFVALSPGQMVSVADVFATATDEPDYGLDIKLWEDSKSSFGLVYGFGEQPFGNPKLEYGTQAPFHMGFYHEPAIVDWAASEITHTLPEYRIHLFFSLAKMAFNTGHDYWGWRFAGLGAHYIQDLTQPYHAKVMPGESTTRLLYTGTLSAIGITGPKTKLVEQASDEHLTLEKQAYCSVLRTFQLGAKNDLVSSAIRQSNDDKRYYTPLYVREVLAAESYDMADEVALSLRPLLGSAQPGCAMPNSIKSEILFARLMKNFGQHTRGFIRAILAARKMQK